MRIKVDLLRQKLKINKNGRMEEKVARENKGNWGPSEGPRERSKLFQETPIRRWLLG